MKGLKKETILNWLSNKENLGLFALILFTIALRIYYFVLTNNQPLWWDEADYMAMAKSWAFGTHYISDPVRPILFSLISSLFFKIANSEFLPRLFIEFLSFLSVIGTYLLGKEIYNKKIGLIAGFMMSVFYLNLFFGQRLLVDIPSLTFFIFSALFFYRYFKKNSKKDLYIATIITAIGTLFKINTALILIGIVIYFLFTKKISCLKRKEIWISILIFILILLPYLIWGYFEFGSFVLSSAASRNFASTGFLFTGISVLKNYLCYFPTYLFSLSGTGIFIALSAFLLIALFLIFLFNLVIGFDLIVKEKKNSPELFLLLLFLVPLILTSFLIGHNENRYILNSFPAVFIILSSFLITLFNFIKKNSKFLAVLLIVALLSVFAYAQLQYSYNLTENKMTSYSQVKDAGIWIKSNLNKENSIMSNSPFQIQYYSDVKTLSFPKTEEEFLVEKEHLSHIVLSGFEAMPEWVQPYIAERNLNISKIFFTNDANHQPIVIIYDLN